MRLSRSLYACLSFSPPQGKGALGPGQKQSRDSLMDPKRCSQSWKINTPQQDNQRAEWSWLFRRPNEKGCCGQALEWPWGQKQQLGGTNLKSHTRTLPLGPATLKDRYGQKQKLKEHLRVPWGLGDLHRQGRVFRIQKGQW